MQDVVVILLRLFDEPLQTDVTSDFVAVLVQREQGEQARHASVAVAEWMDAKEIKDERADGHERRDVVFVEQLIGAHWHCEIGESVVSK